MEEPVCPSHLWPRQSVLPFLGRCLSKLPLAFFSPDDQWNGSPCSQSSSLVQGLLGWRLLDSAPSPRYALLHQTVLYFTLPSCKPEGEEMEKKFLSESGGVSKFSQVERKTDL